MELTGKEARVSQIADQAYLRSDQYKDATKFNARVDLHKRFSTNKQGWLRWAFEQLDLPAECTILEIGCGPGYLWQDNAERIPPGWQVTLADFSPGMLAEARSNLAPVGHPFAFEVADAQELPFADASFDAVIANHMLYHVPDRDQAYAEIKRVLRPDGRFFAATNGEAHLREIHALAAKLDVRTAAWGGVSTGTFLLENGGAEIERWFGSVELRRYPDSFIIHEAEPIVAFILSMADTQAFTVEERAALVQAVEAELAAHGPLHVAKDAGLFLAVRN